MEEWVAAWERLWKKPGAGTTGSVQALGGVDGFSASRTILEAGRGMLA